MLVLCYPVGIFLLLGLTGTPYFGIGSLKLALISAVIIAIGFSMFGYYGLLSNTLKGIANSGYSVVGDEAYYDGKLIDHADGPSFAILYRDLYSFSRAYYAIDKQHLYYAGKVVPGALAEDIHEVENSRGMYWHNSQQIIYDDKVLPGANAGSFAVFEGFTGWSYSSNDDQYNVFCYGTALPVVDRDSFTPLNNFYARDKYRVFHKEKPILPEADAPSFELLPDHNFARDAHHVYYLATEQPFAIESTDPDSFEVLERGYARDSNHIYVVEQYLNVTKLEQADVDSFEVTQYDETTKSEAKDARHYYYDGKIVGDR
jgi:hypothetical protein